MVVVPVDPSTVPLVVVPVTVRSWVDWFSMRSLPSSFDARTLFFRAVLLLISDTRDATVFCVALTGEPVPLAIAADPPVTVCAVLVISIDASLELTPVVVLVSVRSPPSHPRFGIDICR